MERTRFLQHYRIRIRSDGSPYEVDRNDAAVTYEAVDERTAEPVSLKLIPVESIDPAARGHFEEQISTAQKLRHVNIAKVFDFGREGSDFVYVSEHLPGEMLAAWVRSHGPMRADAALRVAEQIVSVLSSASFHKLPYPSIQPSDVMIVPGQTPEGTWPLIKLTNFGLPPVRPDREKVPTEAAAATAEPSASAEQLATAPSDIRSEIFLLGATLYFLLTGVALSAEAIQQGPKFSRFPKPLRNLLARMLNRDPDKRPRDLVVLAEMIRECLLKIERRRALADKYGIPFRTTIPRRPEARPARLLRIALPIAALLLAAAVIAAVLLREPIGRMVHGNRETKKIGVLVGVPESSPPAAASQNASTTKAAETVESQRANSAAPFASEPVANSATASNSPQQAPSQDIQQTQTMNARPQATAQMAPEAASPPAIAESSSSSLGATKSSAKPDETAPPIASSQSSSHSKKKSVASNSRRERAGQTAREDSTQRGGRSVHARVVGITSDGRLILRLPSGRTAFVAPDDERDELAPRRHRRAMIDRDEMSAPPPRFEPDYFPND
jgi:serine/threonine protein kinase